MRAALRCVLLPLTALGEPGAALDMTGSRHAALALASVLFLVCALGAASLPRLLALLAATLAPVGPPLAAGHAAALHQGLVRYVVADRLLPPLPLVAAALLVAGVATPILAVRRVAGRAVCGVLAVGAAPLVVQRLGELAVVWTTPADGLVAGDVAGLAARFNVGLAGLLSAAGQAPGGALSVVAEAANAIGIWVVALWGWGLARLDRDASRRRPRPVAWPFVLSALAYGAGYAAYAVSLPSYLMLVMGVP
jgi:hypothetical protein